MTQFKCPECGKTFNDTEQACPNCGCPASLIPIQNDENRRNNQQNMMIALAIPIGILSLAIAFYILFRALCYWTNINISKSQIIIMESVDYIVEITAFTLIMVWFLSLYQGSAKNLKLKTISIVALMGICCLLLCLVIYGWVFLKIDVFGGEHVEDCPKWVLNWRLCSNGWYDNAYGSCGFFVLSYLLKYVLIGGAFFALSEYFQGKMRIYGMLAGIGFLTIGLMLIIRVIVFYVGYGEMAFDSKGVIASVANLICYISIALFFFGFSKSNKS